MAGDLRRDISRLPSPEAAKSEDNMSVQVNLDTTSNRGKPARNSRPSSRSQSPSRAPGPPSRVRTADNSQSSVTSSQQDLGPAEPAEHVLRDLITPTDSNNNALVDALQRLKRSRDGESEDAPRPKRDKLFDELLEMEGTFCDSPSDTATMAASAASGVRGMHPSRGADTGPRTPASESSTAIPIRGTRRQPPRQARGTVAAPAATAAGSQNGLSGTMNSMTLGDDGPGEPEDGDSGT